MNRKTAEGSSALISFVDGVIGGSYCFPYNTAVFPAVFIQRKFKCIALQESISILIQQLAGQI
jgi:hypothetical protein